MGSQFCEYILQIIIKQETVGFGGLHQTVHDGTGLGTTDGIHIDPVLTADSEGADGTFCRVVVHGNITVIQKDTETRFLIQTVLQGFVGVATGWNGLHGSGQKPVEFLIEDVQADLCGAHHPVGHGVGLKSYPTVLITAGLPFQRKMIVVFPIDDGNHQRGRGDAVAEEIRGTSGLNNAAVIVPGGVVVDMVLIHKESLGDDGQTLIASDPPVRFYDRRNAGS